MEDDEGCITGLSLGLGIMGGNHHVPKKEMNKQKKVPCLDLSFELFCPKGEEEEEEQEKEKQEAIDQQQHDDYDKAKGSSLFCLKHPNETSPDDDDSNNNSNNNGSSRKKLKLTKEQSATLEDIFRLHSTLNPAQKQALAEQLNLKHRQVEVWFQNRRARTKLKQTEVDCEFLKKCCEKLTDENLRLKKELQELRAQQKIGPTPLYIQLSKATTLTICSSCEKLLKKPNEENNKGAINKLKNSTELGGI